MAVKELLPGGNSSEQRFFREALITSRLEHPGIVPVHEAGRWPDGTPFYTMKLVGGRSLHARISELRTLEERLALLPNVIAVADAIAYAHECGVIHRDLKPSNVMVGDFGETIVIDWGLAKVLDDSADETDDGPYRSPARDELTVEGSVLGTPAYMAPEQYQGQSDKRTDIYALGGILHHLLTGSAPHARSASLDFTDPALRYARNTPADLVAIAKRALARDPARRYQTASAFAEDLKSYLRRDRVAARRYSIFSRLSLVFARHRTVALVLLVALTVLTVTFGVALVKVRRERAEAVAAQRMAIVNNAATLFDRDPTRAWEVLRSLPMSDSPPLLRARIRAAGLADYRRKLPATFQAELVLPAGDSIVFATSARTLERLDIESGELVRIAEGRTGFRDWYVTDERVYIVRQGSPLTIVFRPLKGGPITELAALKDQPQSIGANTRGVLWLSPDGTLYQADVGRPTRVVANDITTFFAFNDQVAVCTKTHRLEIGPSDAERTAVGDCDPHGMWNFTSRGFIHASAERFYVFADGHLRTIPGSSSNAMRDAVLSDTGLVAGVGANGDALLLRANADAVEHFPVSSPPIGAAAYGRLAGWLLKDGTVEIIDSLNSVPWSEQDGNRFGTIGTSPEHRRCPAIARRIRNAPDHASERLGRCTGRYVRYKCAFMRNTARGITLAIATRP